MQPLPTPIPTSRSRWPAPPFLSISGPFTNQDCRFSRVPLRIDVPPVTDLAVGQGHVCVLTSDGNVRCWGSNYSGQIAASDQSTFDTPVLVSP